MEGRESPAPNSSNQTTPPNSFLQRRVTRRGLLYEGGIAVATGLAANAAASSKDSLLIKGVKHLWNWTVHHRENRIQQAQQTSSQAAVNPTKTEAPVKSLFDTLNEINALPVASTDRQEAETKYVAIATTLEQIDKGLEVVTDWQLRIQLYDKRYQIRIDGPEEITGLRKPTPEEEAWCDKPHKGDDAKRRVHPEAYLGLTDDFFKALKDLEDKEAKLGKSDPKQGKRKLFGIFKQDLLEEVIKIVKGKKVGRLTNEQVEEVRLINCLPKPGGMLGIRFAESRALKPGTDQWYVGANIGQKSTEDSIDQKEKEELEAETDPGKKAAIKAKMDKLRALYIKFRETLSADGPLKYPAKSIPSSKTIDIGPNQFSVETLSYLFPYLKDNFNIVFNPMGNSAREAYLFIGRGSAWTDTKTGERIIQKGYLIGDKLGEIDLEEEFRKPALNRQNPTLAETNYLWALEYSEDIVETGIFDQKIVPWYREHYHIKAA